LVKLKSRSGISRQKALTEERYTLAHYKELFKQAALPLRVKSVNLSSGFKYYMDKFVNGLTHARYAFIGRKPTSPAPLRRFKSGEKGISPRSLVSPRRKSRTGTRR
jgi:hypothetical protein